jgi:Glycosyl hydrolase family 20, catalytic domain
MFKYTIWKSLLIVLLFGTPLIAQSKLDKVMPVRAFCISAPKSEQVDKFVKFINVELFKRGVNTLILRVDFNYQFVRHPELRDPDALSFKDIRKILKACKDHKIRLIPQINLLGHQSWAETTHNLLRVYPQFDETPWVKMPKKHVWPNKDGLYCKSYCPLHKDIHKIVFDLMDEICAVFEADAFHAGMDEVFYIGEDKCPRCKGKDKAKLFADEVNAIQAHLALKKRQLWIWGDRLIDGKTTKIWEWEGSMNNTFRAVDLISKKVVICDWHYEKAEKTAPFFANKDFNVITCAHNMPAVAVQQTQDMVQFRKTTTGPKKERYQGMMQTVWSEVAPFLDEFYSKKTGNTAANCFRAMFKEIEKMGGK